MRASTAPTRGRTGAWSSARFRVLASYVLLLALSGGASIAAIHEVLVIRAEDRARDALDQEVRELRELLARESAAGRGVLQAFDAFLAQGSSSWRSWSCSPR